MFGIVVLGSTFGTKTEEGTRDWRNCIMRGFVICICHHMPLGCQMKDGEWAGYQTRVGQQANKYVQDLVGKSVKQEPLGRSYKCKWENDIRMDLNKLDGKWIHLKNWRAVLTALIQFNIIHSPHYACNYLRTTTHAQNKIVKYTET